MSDLYTTLRVSPKKKRALPTSDDEDVLTPKRLRRDSTVPPTPSTSSRRKTTAKAESNSLPEHLSRLHKIQTALHQALSHALATCAVSPSEDTGIVRNVLNHMSLGGYTGFATRVDVDDLKRLCWLWEWDGKALSLKPGKSAGDGKAEEDGDENPFLDNAKPPEEAPPKDWSRGGMGIVITQTTFHRKSTASRVPAYGIGIEVEMDIDKDMRGGIAAVARWAAASDTRGREVLSKLQQWVKLHAQEASVPPIPTADLPPLPTVQKPSTLTRLLATSSPKSPSASSILTAPQPPGSPTRGVSRSPSKSPSKKASGFPIPFPSTPSSRLATPSADRILNTPTTNRILKTPSADRNFKTSADRIFKTPSTDRIFKTPTTDRIFKTPTTDRILKTPTTDRFFKTPTTNRILFPKTPSSCHSAADSDTELRTPTSSRTPSLSGSSTPTASDESVPSTPVHQRGPNAATVPQTPTSSRRLALFERVRQRSLQNTPTKANPTGAPMSKDVLFRLGQEEMRRRCLLGRLSGVAESVWMFFTTPVAGAATAGTRKRRAMPESEVAAAVIKSSPVPLSAAEAQESLAMLVKLCPFFLKRLNVSGEEWLEMSVAPESDDHPTEAVASPTLSTVVPAPGKTEASPRKGKATACAGVPASVPSSPSKLRARDGSAIAVLTRSPRQVKPQGWGLREVRERIRKELESMD